MRLPPLNAVRAFDAVARLGSVRAAAEELAVTPAAVSQQVRVLEAHLRIALTQRQGRGLVLTEPGELLLKYARRMLALNDEAIAALRGSGLEGVVRFGLPSDFAETWLPAALGRFKRAHPLIRVEASVDRNVVLLERLEKGRLDLAMFFSDGQHRAAQRLATLPMVWIGSAEHAWDPAEPVPLVLFEAPCVFRKAGIPRQHFCGHA